MEKTQLFTQLRELFARMPFSAVLGMEMVAVDGESARIELPWRDELVGNPQQKILHGGVISSVLDTVGGLLAAASVVERLTPEEIPHAHKRLATLGTIDLRTDYLRPGKGERFAATAVLIRAGNKVCVCRMELHNEQGVQIAYGTGTYLVG